MAAANKALPVYVARTNKQVALLVLSEIQRAMYMEMVLARSERTGNLERSVKLTRDMGAPIAEKLTVGDAADVAYGGWWEFGGDNKSPIGQRYRDFYPQGRTIFPTIYRLKPRTDAMFYAVARKLAASATYGR